jgi:hypothetical protein
VTGLIAVLVTACLQGTLHGQPKNLCREFAIRSYSNVAECSAHMQESADEWLRGIKQVGIEPKIAAVRCAPAEAEGDDV